MQIEMLCKVSFSIYVLRNVNYERILEGYKYPRMVLGAEQRTSSMYLVQDFTETFYYIRFLDLNV